MRLLFSFALLFLFFAPPVAAHARPEEPLTVGAIIATALVPGVGVALLLAGEPVADAPVAAPAIDPEIAAIVDGLKGAVQAGRSGQWLLLVMLLLKLVIYGLRLVAKRLPPSAFTNALTSKWGGWALNFGGSLIGAFIAAAATGALSVDNVLALLTAGVLTSLAAAGTRELVKDIKPAQAAGLAAAADPGKTLGA